MTENGALKLMESLQIKKDCELIKTLDFKATVIKALEDLQQYRAIGTIEEFRNLKLKEHNYDNCHNYTCRKKCEKDGYTDAFDELINQLDAEVESSAKFIREYDDSIAQKAYYSGLKHALRIAKEMKGGE